MFEPKILKGPDVPRHMALAATYLRAWASKNNIPLKEAVEKHNKKLRELIDIQLKKDIPILTVQLSVKSEEESAGLKKFLRELVADNVIKEKNLRVYVIGEWYNLDQELVDTIKKAMSDTKESDQYFLNLCVNYDGQQEILTAAKLIARKAVTEKIKIDELNIDMIKENLPSSQFVPAELIIENSSQYTGLLLWDSVGSIIYYSDKYWLDFEQKDFDKAIDYFNKMNKLDLKS